MSARPRQQPSASAAPRIGGKADPCRQALRRVYKFQLRHGVSRTTGPAATSSPPAGINSARPALEQLGSVHKEENEMTASGRLLQNWTDKSPLSPAARSAPRTAGSAFSTRPPATSTSHSSPSSRGPCVAYRVGRMAICAWALVGGLLLASAGANAGAADRYWNESLAAASRCEAAVNDSASAGLRCLLGSGLDLVSNEGLRFANEAGKEVFGEHFQVVGNLTWSPTSARACSH